MKRAEEDALLSWIEGLVATAEQCHKKLGNIVAETQVDTLRLVRRIVTGAINDSRAARKRKPAMGGTKP